VAKTKTVTRSASSSLEADRSILGGFRKVGRNISLFPAATSSSRRTGWETAAPSASSSRWTDRGGHSPTNSRATAAAEIFVLGKTWPSSSSDPTPIFAKDIWWGMVARSASPSHGQAPLLLLGRHTTFCAGPGGVRRRLVWRVPLAQEQRLRLRHLQRLRGNGLHVLPPSSRLTAVACRVLFPPPSSRLFVFRR
jgi:hypothetical protein